MGKHLFHPSVIRISWMVSLATITLSMALLWPQVDSTVNPLKTERWFTQRSLDETHHLFDLGVADINDDNWLDVYTVNHSARQSILINHERGEFTDQLVTLGLYQNPRLPGVGPTDIEPLSEVSGLYIYWYKSALVVRSRRPADLDPIRGQIRLPESVAIKTSGSFDATIQKQDGKLMVDFTSGSNGRLTIESQSFFFTPAFQLDGRLPLDQIYIGAEKVHPDSHEFTVNPGRDRHGMAWADFNGDTQTDVFVIRGGGGGKMRPDPVRSNDELLLKEDLTFEDRTLNSGIVKNVCPGRQVALVDFDRDNQLDVYTGCGRGKPPRQFYPNQLHWQKAEGQFVNVAAERGLDIPAAGTFVWLDADNDQDMDLLFADDKTFWLYVNHADGFEPQSIGQHAGKVRQLTIADYDQDGDLDVFTALKTGNILLSNVNGAYKIENPQSVGLPSRSIAANWIDYDNDGLTDLYVFPDGIYRQRREHQFEATHLLESKVSKTSNVFCTWFDADNDGRQDLLIAMKASSTIWQKMQQKLIALLQPQQLVYEQQRDKKFTLPEWKIVLYRNVGASDRWLQLQLIGPKGNRPAIGAHVEVITADGVQHQQVGQADDSIRSQGHYRMYFGLGKNSQINALNVFWPDGYLQQVKAPAPNQLLTIERDSGSI